MKKSRFTAEQMLQAIRQAESGTPVPEISRKLGITEATLYRTDARLNIHRAIAH